MSGGIQFDKVKKEVTIYFHRCSSHSSLGGGGYGVTGQNNDSSVAFWW